MKKQKEMENLMYDFTEDNPATNWITVNDNVMGGRSEGGFSFKKKRLIFSGTTNTNGGGFSSPRSSLGPVRWSVRRWKEGASRAVVLRFVVTMATSL